MDDVACLTYEEWDLTPIPMPTRSTLYALQPIGLGTPLVESLSSYVTRLAGVHCLLLGELIRKVMLPLAGESPSFKRLRRLFESGRQSAAQLNGVGYLASDLLRILELLTLRHDLKYLTLQPLCAVIPAKPKGVVRPKKAWCPVCYEDARVSAQPVYDPLLWALQEVSCCPRHHLPLSMHCPYPDCAQPLPWVAWRAHVGYCSYCQRWLGMKLPQAQKHLCFVEQDESRWQQWVCNSLGTVLALLPTQSALPQRDRIRQVVVRMIEHLSVGTISEISAFAQTIGLSRNMIEFWYTGRTLPEWGMLLRFCSRLGLSLQAFLFDELETLSPDLTHGGVFVPVTPKKRPGLQREMVYHLLEQAAASDELPPPTLSMIAQQSRRALPMLYKIHSTACREIVSRYKTYVQQQKEARLQQFQEEITRISLQLHAQGIFLSQKRIALHLSHPGILRDPRLRTFLHELCREIQEQA